MLHRESSASQNSRCGLPCIRSTLSGEFKRNLHEPAPSRPLRRSTNPECLLRLRYLNLNVALTRFLVSSDRQCIQNTRSYVPHSTFLVFNEAKGVGEVDKSRPPYFYSATNPKRILAQTSGCIDMPELLRVHHLRYRCIILTLDIKISQTRLSDAQRESPIQNCRITIYQDKTKPQYKDKSKNICPVPLHSNASMTPTPNVLPTT